MKKRLYYLDFLRIIAIFFILNFHLDIVYPQNLQLLAFGGDIGNDIFFFLAGYLAYESISNKSCKQFISFYSKKLLKIMPIYLFFLMLPYIVPEIAKSKYWFVSAILIFYICDYLALRIPRMLHIPIFITLIAFHLYVDGDFAERYIIGFIASLFGCYLKELEGNKIIYSDNKSSRLIKWLITITVFVGFAICKKNYTQYSDARVIHLLIGIFLISFVVFLFLLLGSYQEIINKVCESRPGIAKCIAAVSMSSIYIYLVQICGHRGIIETLNEVCSFPLSYIISASIIVILGVILMETDNGIRIIIRNVINHFRKG